MATGTLKRWRPERGFGIIKDDGGAEVFLPIDAVRDAGIFPASLIRGERLTFDVYTYDGKSRACNVRRPG